MADVEIQCAHCGKTFFRKRGEVNRSKKLGRKQYCSLECAGQAHEQFLPKVPRPENLRRGSSPDEYSPFREYLKLAKRRTKKRKEEFCLTLEDLKQQWEKQNGICPLTGLGLEIPPTTAWHDSPLTLRRASLDRIDSSIGYIPGNIRFIAVIANFCKNEFTDDDVFEFCEAVVAYRNGDQPLT